jgi:hypothetical protein
MTDKKLKNNSIRECALCGSPITDENDSKEHLIPNAIGGRKKITGFICNGCNNKSGEDWDSDLASQLNSLSVFFGISRERGTPPSHAVETTRGEQIQLYSDGSMGLVKPKCELGKKINIEARSIKEAKKILSGLKRKYPQIDIDKTMTYAQSKSYYPEGMIKFRTTIGGPKTGRSIVKSCLALAVESGINPQMCKIARNYLISNGEDCFGFYYERDLIINRPENVVFHCISITGNPDTKQLLGYIEYYGIWRIITCLSDEYDGDKFSRTYALNPISGNEIEMVVDISSISQEDIAASYRHEKISADSVKKAFNKIISIGVSISREKEMERITNEAVQYAFKNCGAKEGEILTEEHISKMLPILMEKLEPFIAHQMRKPEI